MTDLINFIMLEFLFDDAKYFLEQDDRFSNTLGIIMITIVLYVRIMWVLALVRLPWWVYNKLN